VAQDHQQALSWYRKAADAGDVNAKKLLADLDAK
jgi:TPR repeat protein